MKNSLKLKDFMTKKKIKIKFRYANILTYMYKVDRNFSCRLKTVYSYYFQLIFYWLFFPLTCFVLIESHVLLSLIRLICFAVRLGLGRLITVGNTR